MPAARAYHVDTKALAPQRRIAAQAFLLLAVLGSASCERRETRGFLDPAGSPPPETPDIVQVTVHPKSGTVERQQLIGFNAIGTTSTGEIVSVPIQWSATGGTISPTGEFHAEIPGQYWIKAKVAFQAEVVDSVMVVVVGPENPVGSLDITEARVTLDVGASHRFEVEIRGPDGGVADVPVYWTASIGTIDLNGVYSAPAEPGQAVVIAVAGYGVTDTAIVDIEVPRAVTALALTPDQATMAAGEVVQFVASATWNDGSTATPALDFSATGGVIDSDGRYTAGSTPGRYQVTVKTGDVSATAAIEIVLEPIVGLAVSPRDLRLAPGSGFTFAAAGRLATGATRATPVVWSAHGGTITQEGHYVAGPTAGTFRVIATAPELELADTVLVAIFEPEARLNSLLVNPSSLVLPAGGIRQFSIAASWSDGSNTVPSVTWSATGGTVSANGIYVAGPIPGSFRVIATHESGLADTSAVEVTVATLAGIEVAPGVATVEKGRTLQFSVTGHWSDGTSTAPAVTWTAAGGTITPAGLFTAGSSSGTFRVIATNAAASRADTALVTIISTAPILAQLTVSPGTVSLVSGASQQFNVTPTWSNGGSGSPTVVWSAAGGRITSRGRFTAGTEAGTFRVVVRQLDGEIADTAWVTVTPPAPELTAITLAPSTVTLQAGGTRQFTVNGIWTGGGSGAPAVRWTVTGGNITSGGLYTAGSTPGTYRVIATQVSGVLADTSVVTITGAQPVLTGITVTPGSASLEGEESVDFDAAGIWTNGGSGSPSVTWSATGGTISMSGRYRAGTTPGTYRVVARLRGGSYADTAAVTIGSGPAPTLTRLAISPKTVSVQTGVEQQFTASATWSNGSKTLPAVTWKATGGTINASGRYKAPGTAGSYRVIVATEDGSLADTSSVVVSAPVVSQLTLTPATVSLSTGGVQQFSTSATWSDGVNRPVAVTYSATGGTVSVNGLYTAGQVAGSFLVIASCSCGKADTSRISVTGAAPIILSSLTLSPTGVTVSRGGSQQFSVIAYLTDGSVANPLVSWSATGGTISNAGLYTAGSSDGSYRIIATLAGGLLADTTTIRIQGVAAPSSMFFNSAEPGCGSDPNVLMCDDFEDGDWYTMDADRANATGGLAQTDGWAGTIYGPITPAACNNDGFRSRCAASHGRANGSSGNVSMADHSLAHPSPEIYARFYTKPLAGYQFGAEKVLSVNKGPAGVGGIYFGNLHFNCGGSASSTGRLAWQPVAPEDGCRSVMSLSAGRWYFIELHMNTATGVLRVWADDCGESGTGCSGTPTLRLNVSGFRFPSGAVGSLWWENWANPGSTGTRLIDQIVVSRVGPIGFMK